MREIKILIVEDEVMIAECIKLDLEDEGYTVYDYVTSGEKAVKVTENRETDLILMDINLSGKIDGIEAAKEIIDRDNIPIIFMTGYDENSIFDRAQELHPVAYLHKPVDISDLNPILEFIFK
jgi:two-component system, response regulator PdtaR